MFLNVYHDSLYYICQEGDNDNPGALDSLDGKEAFLSGEIWYGDCLQIVLAHQH